MPIYQYKCTDCGHQLEALQKMSDPLLSQCPACQSHGLRKQLTAAAFKLKGGGWYETDFKNSGSKPAADKTATGKSGASGADAVSGGDTEKSAAKSSSQTDSSVATDTSA